MGYYDLASGAKTVQAAPAVVRTGHITGATIDTKGCDSLYCVVNMGTFIGDGTSALKLEHSDASNMSDVEDITGATFTAMSTSLHEGVQVGRLNLTGAKRYVRCYGTHGGSGTHATVVGVVFIMGTSNSAEATAADFNLVSIPTTD
tara:strand:- start:280 stop:717 length:438 start_codon:yes stop_codon:yes gene_type:complete